MNKDKLKAAKRSLDKYRDEEIRYRGIPIKKFNRDDLEAMLVNINEQNTRLLNKIGGWEDE